MGLNVNWEAKIIEVTSPTTEVDAQTLHDFIEDNMATSKGMGYGDIINPEGKVEDPSNPGVYSQIIIILNSPWQIQFWAGSGYTRIYGGKIVGGLADEPMKATGNAGDITVLESPVDGLTVATSSGVTSGDVEDIVDGVWDEAQAGHTTPDTFGEYLDAVVSGVGGGSITENDIEDIKSLIESQRGGHTWSGNIFYVDPINGTSFGSGATGKKDNPLLSVQDCHDNLVTDSNHDVIMLLSGNPSGSTTMDEAVTLSKRYVFIRGPGRDFLWTTTSVGDTISVTADGIELSGFQISTYTIGVGAGIDIAGSDFTQVKNVWVNYTRGDAISISNSSNTIINSCTLQESGVSGAGHGIAIDPAGGGSSHTLIRNNHISDIQGDAIRLIGGTVEHTIIESNEIHDSTGYGINIGIGVTDSFITGNVLGNNASGDIVDAGTDTIEINNEQWATDASVADAVWDEDSGEHISIGTFGKLLADLLEDTSTTIPGLINTMQTNVTELLGLTGENVKWSSITHDANNLMTAARITQYTDNTLVTPIKSWDVTATYNGSGEIISYQMAEV